ncbi:uncharacterized protein LOC111713187 [Eurytemora carolleeae]|uniref:uncharacterized protein LOC111713187 n=1 Tax=Eurytemora carolleeae TaxID=1294199 RepID=UPI000C78D300|nr:uncharacterized protein LOC111713187 [Eurytemora carolleeae]|eukprot:XP_023343777.1 uncharacterized protein LOC111713187 [Eurytemora affinis]
MKWVILFGLISLSYGLPTGAPECVDNPAHYGTSAQTGPSGIEVNTEMADDGSVFIQVLADSPFKGVLITTTGAGQFLVPDGQPLQLMTTCTGITHVSNATKSEVNAIFIKDDPAGSMEFNMIIVRDFATYWTGIKF